MRLLVGVGWPWWLVFEVVRHDASQNPEFRGRVKEKRQPTGASLRDLAMANWTVCQRCCSTLVGVRQ